MKYIKSVEQTLQVGIKPYKDYARFREIINRVNEAAIEKKSVEIVYYTMSGLSPPSSLFKRHREPSPAAKLWRALSMLLYGSKTLSASPCLLMARAREKSEQRLAPFLV
jgi:hypothetical protein